LLLKRERKRERKREIYRERCSTNTYILILEFIMINHVKLNEYIESLSTNLSISISLSLSFSLTFKRDREKER